jgi:nicotinate-nucleotide pyrophosphorylase (carboxylating)
MTREAATNLDAPAIRLWDWLVDAALDEDLGSAGDVTSEALLPADATGSARIEARHAVVVSGLAVAGRVFERCGARLEAERADGEELGPGDVLARVSGPARALLAGERSALNFLQRLCGIATQTRRYCAQVRGTQAAIVDTRKTTPGWRALEKYAVRCGGGTNHRIGLFDGILIKDNHIAAVGDVGSAVRRARERGPFSLRVLVEVESLAMAQAALDAGADALLVDNQPVPVVAQIVQLCAGRGVDVEASGGITLDNVAAYAKAGVDRISIGALTHSAPAADLGLEWNERSTR